jgi:hypothetical protein
MVINYLFAAVIVIAAFATSDNDAFQDCSGFGGCETNVGLIVALAAPSFVIALSLGALCGGLASLLDRKS